MKWAGLRCRVKVTGQFDGCKVDLRDKAADPTTSLLCDPAVECRRADMGEDVGTDGNVALVVQDDTREGTATTLVLARRGGNVDRQDAGDGWRINGRNGTGSS